MSNEDGEALKVQRDKCQKMLANSFKLMRHVQTVHKKASNFNASIVSTETKEAIT